MTIREVKRSGAVWRSWSDDRRPAAVAVVGLALALAIHAAPARAYDLEIDKTARVLVVRDGDTVKKTFQVALGRGGRGTKQYFGDNKTPVGTYRIVGVNPSTRFDTFLRLSYPNLKDAYYGLQAARISRGDFERILGAVRRNQVPPQNTPLGGSIGIHGLGEETPEKIQIHDHLDWTEGCIALRNADLHELRAFVDVGTRVVIRE
jgi:murein L,D-transpeptidase YafK